MSEELEAVRVQAVGHTRHVEGSLEALTTACCVVQEDEAAQVAVLREEVRRKEAVGCSSRQPLLEPVVCLD